MSDVLEIRVKKSHIAILSVVILVASASAAVNVRDSISVFGELDMQGNKVTNATEYRFTENFVRKYDDNNDGKIDTGAEITDALTDFGEGSISETQLLTAVEYFKTGKSFDRGVKAAALTENGKILASGAFTGTEAGPSTNFTFSSDIDMQGNNIYNVGNISGTGGGGSSDGSLVITGSHRNSDYKCINSEFATPEVTATVSCDDPQSHIIASKAKTDQGGLDFALTEGSCADLSPTTFDYPEMEWHNSKNAPKGSSITISKTFDESQDILGLEVRTVSAGGRIICGKYE